MFVQFSKIHNFRNFHRRAYLQITIGGDGGLNPILEWEMYRTEIRKERPKSTPFSEFFFNNKAPAYQIPSFENIIPNSNPYSSWSLELRIVTFGGRHGLHEYITDFDDCDNDFRW